MIIHTCALRECCESEASLYYTVSSRLPSETLPHTQHDKQSRAKWSLNAQYFPAHSRPDPFWLPCLLGKCHSLWTIWSLGIRHIPAHSTHFLGLYNWGLTNSFGDHPKWGGGGITWPCYGSQSHLFGRANTHQWRINATDWEGSPAQVSVGTYPHTLWIFPPLPNFSARPCWSPTSPVQQQRDFAFSSTDSKLHFLLFHSKP